MYENLINQFFRVYFYEEVGLVIFETGFMPNAENLQRLPFVPVKTAKELAKTKRPTDWPSKATITSLMVADY